MINFQAYYNLITNNNFMPDGTTQNTSGADFKQSSGTFYNNVLVGNCASNSKLGSIYVYPDGISNVTIKNNIVMNDRSAKDMDFNQVGESVVSSDFNLVYNESRAVNIQIGTTDYTWSAYKTFTKQESHSVNADPRFISITNSNFKLQSISPAINKGISIAGITTDYLGKTLSGLRDIGAYEF